MELDKFVVCKCGKKKKIKWIDKNLFLKGKTSFCVGLTQCPSCGIIQEHYSGNMDDIALFVSDRMGDYTDMDIQKERGNIEH